MTGFEVVNFSSWNVKKKKQNEIPPSQFTNLGVCNKAINEAYSF